MTQQEWIEEAYALLNEILFEGQAPDDALVTYGFPPMAGVRACCVVDKRRDPDNEKAPDQTLIFITPREWIDALSLLAVLAHEMVHTFVPRENGDAHGPTFTGICERYGIPPGPESVEMSDGLRDLLKDVLRSAMPPFPGGGWAAGKESSSPTPQIVLVGPPAPTRRPPRIGIGSRLRLWECACAPRPVKVRVASDDFRASCNRCGENFIRKGGGA